MKKFGFSRKEKGGEDEDTNRSALFGSRSKSTLPTSKSSNPYAQPSTSQDPYAKPDLYSAGFDSVRPPSIASQPPSYSEPANNPGPSRNDKSPVPPGGYGNGAPRFSAQGTHSNQSGYGGNPYGSPAQPAASSSRYGPGGYGGLGRSNSQETMSTDAGREALFGDAKQRYQQHQGQGLPPDSSQSGMGDGYSSGAYGSGTESQGYGKYQDRQLTAEEEEDEDVAATKEQIKFIKQQDVSSTRNALRIAQQAEETGRETLARLAGQGERVHNTERNLDLAANQNKLAEEKARELKTVNRSMWAMHVNNPFTKERRHRERDQAIMDKHWEERTQREATRKAAFSTEARHQEQQRQLKKGPDTGNGKNAADRSKYQFEADSEDDEMETEIDKNLDVLGGAVGRLNQLGRAMNDEVSAQNDHIDRVGLKVNKVDDQIVMNRARLDRIR